VIYGNRLVAPVCPVSLVHLVSLVCHGYLAGPDRPDRPDEPDQSLPVLPHVQPFARLAGSLLSQSATGAGVASVAIFIRPWRTSFLVPVDSDKISSKLA